MSNPNTLWAQLFVDELSRAGLHKVCISPGSRSTPLALAFANSDAVKVYPHIDERSAGFFALGMAQASREPVALVCTSGTALANFHPAILEAHYAQIPLLVLSADRPPELRQSGANQTIDQIKMFGSHVRWFVDVALPEPDPAPKTIRYLRTLACRAMATAAGSPAGPVHLNFPFRKPLEPDRFPYTAADLSRANSNITSQEPHKNQPITHISIGSLHPTPDQIEMIVEAIQTSPRGIIICGPRSPMDDFPKAVNELAHVTGFPIFADALSGVRFSSDQETSGMVLGGYETFLQSQVESSLEQPTLILQFGAAPISNSLSEYIHSLPSCKRFSISENGVWTDEFHQIDAFIHADATILCNQVCKKLTASRETFDEKTWLNQLQGLEKDTWSIINTIKEEHFFEGVVLADVVELAPQGTALFVASSLPVRHLDQFAQPHPSGLTVFANRGVSGIDGTIASALGAASVIPSHLVLVIGDLAFYHDLNSLIAVKKFGINITIVLINNDGGGIFHRLPISNFEPPFMELFVSPHGLDFEPAAQLFNLDYHRVSSRSDFKLAFNNAMNSNQSTLIEVPGDAKLHEKTRQEIVSRLRKHL
ncbi:MAG: 2-succinyl-5-enolpyruvyl-6-hydroxy-3-cyclohexene-1-carboxylic-acid synthase [Anaerolineae bacterium]|nr:2-succinyl-5-enolpyruvyl-6-hydroxy-3-cyclohexene-1-carboxylic-acid synthase [Anaerolineae bacterium]